MQTKYTLTVTSRAQTGRSASRRLRKGNRIPAILYGKRTEPEKLSIEGPEFTRLLKTLGGRAVLLELARDGAAEKALSFLQEIQRDPITDRFLHVDLHEVKPDEKFEIRVPILLAGEAFGVKNQSGVLEVNTHTLRIRTLPKDMPAVIEVDVSPLKVGETIKLGELKPIPGVEFLDSKGQVVVACVEPVAEVVVEAAATAAAPVEGAAAAPAAGAAPAADGKPAPAGDAKAAAAPAAGAKGAAPAKPAAGAKPAAPAKK